MNQITCQVFYKPDKSGGVSGLTTLTLNEFSEDPLEWPEWLGIFDDNIHQKQISNTENMHYLKTSVTGQAEAAKLGLGWSSQLYDHAWGLLCEKYGWWDVIVNAQIKEIHTHPPIWHDDSTSIVKFAKVVTNVGNTLTQLRYTSDSEAEARPSSTTRKVSSQLREQWLQCVEDRWLLRGNLIVFKDWFTSKVVTHENMLAHTNHLTQKIQSSDKPTTISLASNGDESSNTKNFSSRIDDTHFRFVKISNQIKVNDRPELVQKTRLCFNFSRRGHLSMDCKRRKLSLPNSRMWHNKFLQSDFLQKEIINNVSDATTALATIIAQRRLTVVRTKLTKS